MARKSRIRLTHILLAAVVTLFALVSERIAYIMLTEKDVGKDYRDPEVASVVIRGDIVDRDGSPLSSSTSQWALCFRLSAMDDLNYAAMAVSPYINMTVDEIVAQASEYQTYALIKSRLDMETAETLQEVIDSAGLSNSVVLEKRSARSYAGLFHAAQLVGFANAEGVGSEGIEYSYEDSLSPYPGLGEDTTYGDTVQLTIDMDVQYLVDVQAQNIAIEHSPDYVMGMVVDGWTGEVLAMSSYPWYDLNWYNLSTDEERLNRTVAYNYEPGSVFKVFTLAKCMEEGVDTSIPFVCDGSETFTVNGSSFTINCHTAHGEVDAEGMIAESCNGAIVQWALQVEDEAFRSFLLDLGFGSRPGVDLPAVTSGYVAPVSAWSNRTKATMSFGQEISVNALQICQAATALANKGVLTEASVVKRVISHEGEVKEDNSSPETRRVMSEETAERIIEAMEEAVASGTATKAAVDGVRVAAKTGTAQIANEETGSYDDGPTLASTLAVAPADNPRYIVYFAVSAPSGDSVWGADVAAPACSAVIRGLASQGRIPAEGQATMGI